MEERYYMHLNMLGNQIKNGVLEKLSTEPVTGLYEGRIYYNTTTKDVWFYDGTSWQSFWDSNEDVAWLIEQVNIILAELENSDDETIAYILDQIDNIIPGTISDHISNTSNPHSTTLEKARLAGDTLAGDINMGQNTVTNLKEPVTDSDAATKAYVDATAQGLRVRKQLDYATTDNLTVTVDGSQSTKTLTSTVNGILEIDGMNPPVGSNILVKDQTNAVDNGIYIVTDTGSASTPFILTRNTNYDDYPDPVELNAGNFFFIKYGSTLNSTGWVLTSYNISDPVVDTDPLVFVQFSGAGTYTGIGSIKFDGNTIYFDAAESAGTGLIARTVAGQTHILDVVGYTPITGTTVQRKRIYDINLLAETLYALNHNFGVQVSITALDSTGRNIEISWQNINTNQTQLYSTIGFTAKIIVTG